VLAQAGRIARGLQFGEQLPTGRLVHPLGAAKLLDRRQADMNLRADRLGNLGPQILADGAAGDAAEHLAKNEAEGRHVVALRCARLPPGFGTGQLLTDEVPVDELLGGQPIARADDPGAVTHHHRQSDGVLAGLPELGPVTGDRSM
jgi:hypothetical protein